MQGQGVQDNLIFFIIILINLVSGDRISERTPLLQILISHMLHHSQNFQDKFPGNKETVFKKCFVKIEIPGYNSARTIHVSRKKMVARNRNSQSDKNSTHCGLLLRAERQV